MSNYQVWLVAGVESILLLLVCAYMTYHFAAKDRTPFYVIVLTTLSFFLSFMIIFLIPIDIYTYKQNKEENQLIVTLWSLNYWSVFILNWFVLPILQEYLAAGDFTVKERVMRSLRNNIPLLVIYFVAFIIIIIVLAFTDSGRKALQNDGMIGCVIGLSLVFGLLSIVLLLGYGLVEIPKQYFKHASNRKKLHIYQCKVAEYDDKLKEKAKKVQTLIEIIQEVQVEPELEQYKAVLQKDVTEFEDSIKDMEPFRLNFTSSLSDRMGREFSGVLDYNKLVRLRNRFIYQTTDIVRLICFRREAIETAIFTQDLINSKQRGDMRVLSYYLEKNVSFAEKNQSNCLWRILTVAQYLWLVYGKPLMTYLLAFFFGLLSLIIIYAEIANIFDFKHNLIFDIVTSPDFDIHSPNYFYISNLFCLIPLVYLVYATNYGLFQLKVSNIYALHSNHHTDPPCLMFSSMLIMRMAVPIAYNFLQLTHVDRAAIFIVMGPVKYLSFMGEDFNRWVFPICLSLMALMTIFRVYERILSCIGLKQYAFGSQGEVELADDGRYIIEQFKSEMLMQMGQTAMISAGDTGPVPSSYRSSSIGYEKVDYKGGNIVVNLNQVDDDFEASQNDALQKPTGYSSRDSQELQQDFDNDEEYERRKGIASHFQKLFRKKK